MKRSRSDRTLPAHSAFQASNLSPRPRPRRYFHTLESLESRTLSTTTLAVAANGKNATYTDVDGDKVTIAVSSGAFAANGSNFTTLAKGFGDQLEMIDLTAGGFDGATLTVTVARVGRGDGLANIGYINSTGHNLGNVTINGDLGRIDAGNGTAKLSVGSLGRLGLDTQGGSGSLRSNINGPLTALVVTGDVNQESLFVSGILGSVTIGGSLIGGDAADSGYINSTGNIGVVKIRGNVEGGAGSFSGSIVGGASMASITIGGSMIGGIGSNSGAMSIIGSIGSLTIAHNLVGGMGAGNSAGNVLSYGTLASVKIGGSIMGGASPGNGQVDGNGAIGQVKIGQDVQGGPGTSTGALFANTSIGNVTIGGSLIGGIGTNSGVIGSNGNIGALKIGHNLVGGLGAGTGAGMVAPQGTLASVSIGGSIIGGVGADNGLIYTGGAMGPVTIRLDVHGGAATRTGTIFSGAALGHVTIGGSLIGGAGQNAGEIFSWGNMARVKIGGNVQGGSGNFSGEVGSGFVLAGVSIGGSLIGGTANASGVILSESSMGAVMIGHDLVGGSIGGTAFLDETGYVESLTGRIAGVSVRGSIVAGTNTSVGLLTKSASIRAANDIGFLTVEGSIVGNATAPVIIAARGRATQTATDLAIGSLTIGGRVEFANFLAGYDVSLNAMNGDAQIGPVKVANDWLASSLAAGVFNTGGTNLLGNNNDSSIGDGNSAILAKITSITIGGSVFGTPTSLSSTDHFGFVTQQIGSFKAGGVAYPLSPSSDDDNLALGPTLDVNLHEV